MGRTRIELSRPRDNMQFRCEFTQSHAPKCVQWRRFPMEWRQGMRIPARKCEAHPGCYQLLSTTSVIITRQTTIGQSGWRFAQRGGTWVLHTTGQFPQAHHDQYPQPRGFNEHILASLQQPSPSRKSMADQFLSSAAHGHSRQPAVSIAERSLNIGGGLCGKRWLPAV